MSTGALMALTIISAIRDRATSGGSYHGHAALTAYDMTTLSPDVRLYQRDIVKRIQDIYQFAPWSSDAHVAPLYYEIMRAWENVEDSPVKNEDFFVTFTDSVFGSKLRVLGPIVRYEDKECTPVWKSPPVPFCHHKFRGFQSV
jgi:hypothetical protein